jgi:predicted alpha/beta superfamily hydrolase
MNHLFGCSIAGALLVASSQLLAQNSAVDATAAAPLAIGETFTIQSKVLNETRRINVYMPPQYTESHDTRLPVLYMPDGGIAEDFLHVAGLVQVSTGNGTMRPFILVGIENTQRRRDLTGPTQNAEDMKIAPKVGGSAAFRRFIRSELMPVINSRYRTTRETAIIGESLAGLFIAETLFLEPDLFDTYIAFDPSVWWNDGELVNRAAERLKTGRFAGRTIYVASSVDDRAGQLRRFAEVLRSNAPKNLRWEFKSMPNETHGTIYHPAALDALRRLFRPVPVAH